MPPKKQVAKEEFDWDEIELDQDSPFLKSIRGEDEKTVKKTRGRPKKQVVEEEDDYSEEEKPKRGKKSKEPDSNAMMMQMMQMMMQQQQQMYQQPQYDDYYEDEEPPAGKAPRGRKAAAEPKVKKPSAAQLRKEKDQAIADQLADLIAFKNEMTKPKPQAPVAPAAVMSNKESIQSMFNWNPEIVRPII